jgi:hypothetical protein
MSLLRINFSTHLIASRPILFLFYAAVYHHRVRDLSILWIGKDNPYKFLIDSDRVYFPLMISILQHNNFCLGTIHGLVIAFILACLISSSLVVLAANLH